MDIYKILIASYLHDIWKLLYRWEYTNFSNLEDKFTKWHSDIWYKFLYSVLLENWLDQDNFWKDIIYIAFLHHSSDINKYINDIKWKEFFRLVKAVYFWDNISSIERDREDEKDITDYSKKVNKKGLYSLFNFINLKLNNDDTYNYIYKPISLKDFNIEKIIYDNYDINSINDMMPNYFRFLTTSNEVNFKDLTLNFVSDFKKFFKHNIVNEKSTKEELKEFIYKLDILMQTYLSFVPSDAYNIKYPDISLYDHIKLVSAISSVIDISKLSLYNIEKTDDILDFQVSVILWDFPSIQKYIFNYLEKTKYINKRLRARSFLVQLINEAVIEFLLDKLNLFRSNVLINSWWKFVILSKIVDDSFIIKIREEINKYFIDNWYSDIKLNLYKEDLELKKLFGRSESENNLYNLKDTLIELYSKLNKNKYNVYTKDLLIHIFKGIKNDNKIICKYCNKNFIVDKIENENDENVKCEVCDTEIKLWDLLVKDNIIKLKYIEDWKFCFWINKDWINILLFKGDNYEDLDKIFSKKWLYYIKYINTFVPIEDWDIKTLDSFWNNLAIVKWDINFMSHILKNWFQKNYSLSRIVEFSRFLELFFWTISHLYFSYLSKKNIYVYTVYSWWDDFLYILPFDKLKDFLKWYTRLFKNYVCDNKDINFSLWVYVLEAWKPIKYWIMMADEILSWAKKLIRNNFEWNYNVIWIWLYNNDFVFDFDYDNFLNFIDEVFKEVENKKVYEIYQLLLLAYKYLKNRNYSKYILIIKRLEYLSHKNNIKMWFLKDLKNINDKTLDILKKNIIIYKNNLLYNTNTDEK